MAFYSVRSNGIDARGGDSSLELSQVDSVSLNCLGIQTFVLPAVGEVRGYE